MTIVNTEKGKTMSDAYVRVEGLSDSLQNNVTVKEVTENPYKAFGKALLSVKFVDLLYLVRCKDCKWWTKQEDSLQGRCALLQMYPTGTWYCADGERKDK